MTPLYGGAFKMSRASDRLARIEVWQIMNLSAIPIQFISTW